MSKKHTLKTVTRVAAAAALCLGAAGASHALELTSGNYKINFNNYDSGTTYGTPAAGQFCGNLTATNTAAARAGCDAVSTAALGNAIGGGGTYDTMGIFSVQSITNTTNNVVEYTVGTASSVGGVTVGPYLTGIFGGLTDFYGERSGIVNPTITTLSAGGYFTIFSNTADYDITQGPGDGGSNFQPGAQTYDSISPGSPLASIFLSGVFVTGQALTGNADAGYVSSFAPGSLAGSGSGYLDFTGGDALAAFDTNAIFGANGGLVDAKITTTFQSTAAGPFYADCGTALTNQGFAACTAGWNVSSTSDITGTLKVPEPGSMALVGLGLMGLAGLRRRKQQA